MHAALFLFWHECCKLNMNCSPLLPSWADELHVLKYTGTFNKSNLMCVSPDVSSVPIKWVCGLIHTHTIPQGRLKWPYAITRRTTHFMCGLMSDLVICKFGTSMVIHDTKCPFWDKVSQNNTKQTHTHSNEWFVYIFRRDWTKWLYWQARHGVTRIAKWTAAPFNNMECWWGMEVLKCIGTFQNKYV